MSAASQPLLIAHRGDSAGCPENTLAAFRSALATGVDGIELDVRLSRDGVPMVCHDATLARFGGGRRPLSAQSADELKQHDIGSWFAPRFAAERLPTLDEVLALTRGAVTCIELKAGGGMSAVARQRLVAGVVAAIAQRQAVRRVFVLCFEGETLAEVARQAPQVARVRNCERLPRDLERWLDRQRGLTAACFDRRVLTPAVVATCHRRGLMVFAWTANDAAALRRLRALEVDGVLSDRPSWLVEQVRGR